MDDKYIVLLVLAAAVILAVIFKGKTIVSFLGFKLNTEDSNRKNRTTINGDGNKVKQGNSGKGSPANNSASIKGTSNDVEQN